MTCKDCLHYEAHKHFFKSDDYQKSFDDYFNDKHIENKCPEFANRSEWVYLPCKVVDTVYYFDGAYYLKNKSMWKIKPIKVTEFSTKIGRSGKLYPLSIIANGTRYPLTSIGKTIFLTREAAEKALEEKK